ncbi:hypothetical protein Afil01_34180 [Actinorhabdospora filicis]|uniref:Contractile injection system tube protein N-terminal domain-containing protein n=1 Tax=Actinorhabdospora filicis TaxID=1785913 RepID=A0A9W6SPZ2_9ACTN|nr:hypothetical protein [Actinorhabdospora filicis]GLZ78611.1 hypothetical protein Afil01_34180 [Actinorhabdospora filicis]
MAQHLAYRAPVRGFLASVGLEPEIVVEFQFNPDKISDKRSISYATLNAPGLLMPVRQYTSGGDRTLSFTVNVDGRPIADPSAEPMRIERDDQGGIGPELTKYRAFVYPSTDRWQDAATAQDGFTSLYATGEPLFTAPPVCAFGWGDRVIDCVVTEVSISEQAFTPDLRPLRAEIQVTLVEITPYNADPQGG